MAHSASLVAQAGKRFCPIQNQKFAIVCHLLTVFLACPKALSRATPSNRPIHIFLVRFPSEFWIGGWPAKTATPVQHFKHHFLSREFAAPHMQFYVLIVIQNKRNGKPEPENRRECPQKLVAALAPK